MKKQIADNIQSPEKLEELYRLNKVEFRKSFQEISENYNSDLVHFWKLRLSGKIKDEGNSFKMNDLFLLVLISVLTGILMKIPAIMNMEKTELFYMRDAAIIVFNGIILFTFWQNRILTKGRYLFYGFIVALLTTFLHLLPSKESDSVFLSYGFSPLLLWCLFGVVYISFDYKDLKKRIAFIRFNGELLIMTGLILIAGGLLTAITLGLFSVIKINIENFYLEYVVVFGAVAAPIVSSYLIKTIPQITSKIAPVIAKVFTPLVIITLGIYLISFIFSDAKIFEDRDLLILFNVMLIAVMAIIIFSISELEKNNTKNIQVIFLFILALLAIIINTIALTAIITRLFNGLTPNRTVVVVSNILFFVNLILVAKCLFNSYFREDSLEKLEDSIAKYLPVYTVWTIIVIFILPFVFGLR